MSSTPALPSISTRNNVRPSARPPRASTAVNLPALLLHKISPYSLIPAHSSLMNRIKAIDKKAADFYKKDCAVFKHPDNFVE